MESDCIQNDKLWNERKKIFLESGSNYMYYNYDDPQPSKYRVEKIKIFKG